MRPPVSQRRPRLGLCCQFVRAPIRFSTTTAAALRRLPRAQQLDRLGDLCAANADALLGALRYCDAHHHRCLPDGMSVEDATEAAGATWNREPLFHLSSPVAGWTGPDPRRHHDYIAIGDFPAAWHGRPITVELEAKAKELAVERLRRALARRRR